MKKHLSIFIMIFLLTLSASAATVYVSDGASGDGSSASAPLGSLTDAYAALGDEGGEIVICNTVTVPLNQINTTRKAFVEPAHSGKITLSGNDENATLLFASPYEYHMSGETEFRSLTISSGDYTSGINFAARGHHLTMGDGLTMYSTGTYSGQVGTKIYLHGGCLPSATVDGYLTGDKHLTIKSGTYWAIFGFDRNVSATTTGSITMEIGGDVHTHYFIGGTSGSSAYADDVTSNVYIIGDLSISQQLSFGNQHTDSEQFSVNLILKDGVVDFTGTSSDYNKRTRISEFDVYVNTDSADAVATYSKLFAGYGDREGTLADYCTNELGNHSFANKVCTVCGVTEASTSCTSHSFTQSTSGTVITNVCENCDLTVNTTSNATSTDGVYAHVVGDLRVQILSDGIVRVEQTYDGEFIDKATLVVPDRSAFTGTAVAVDEDSETVIISTEKFTVNFPKTDASAASVRIFDKENNLLYNYFESDNNGFYSSLPAPAATPDAYAVLDNGILPADGGLTYTGSTDDTSGWERKDNTDVYVMLPFGDAETLRKQFITVTGPTTLSNIKALGSWYSKWTNYTDEEKLALIQKYRDRGIPLDMMVIDTEWKNTSTNGNDGDGTGYDINTELYPDMEGFLAKAEAAGVLILFNDHTHKTSLLITNPEELKWQSAGIISLMSKGLDGWWYDRNWSYTIKSPYSDVLYTTLGQVLYYDTMAKYHADTSADSQKRVLMLSNVDWLKHGHTTNDTSIIGHRYGIQWTGDIYWDPLHLKREISNMVFAGVSGASPYLSADLGGFWHNDTVSENNFLRWMQYGAFSPVYRPHSTLSSKNEHLPWSYGEDSEAIVKDFLNMRYHLMPLYYSLARENYDTGMPLMRRLDYYYPQYEEAADNTQYIIGKDILVAPYWGTTGDGRDAVPTSWLTAADGSEGLDMKIYNTASGMAKSEYYTDANLVYSGVETNELAYYWYTGSPMGGVNSDYFAVRYTGKITPEYDCYIGTLADDGARVYIGGELWANGWASSQLDPAINTSKALKAGETYDIVIEYYELTGKSVFYFMCEPVLPVNTSERSVFIPDGTWINAFTGEKTVGPKTITVTGDVSTMPLFIRGGAAIPVSKVISPMTGADWQELSINLYGLGNSEFTLYEDDGETEDYLGGEYRKTNVNVEPASEGTWEINIGAVEGAFATEYTKRNVKIRIHSALPISEATVGGTAATVTAIMKDSAALQFAESGGSNISHIYEITAEVDLTTGATILVTTGVLGDMDNSGILTLSDALIVIQRLLSNTHSPVADMNEDGLLSLVDVLKIIKSI